MLGGKKTELENKYLWNGSLLNKLRNAKVHELSETVLQFPKHFKLKER